MKKSTILFLLSVFILMTACKETNPQKLIVKKWKMDIVELKKLMKLQILKNKADTSMAENIINMGATMYENMALDFKANKNYEITGLGKKEAGNWEMSADNQQITFTDIESQKKQVFRIKHIDSQKLILEKSDTDESEHITTFPFQSDKP